MKTIKKLSQLSIICLITALSFSSCTKRDNGIPTDVPSMNLSSGSSMTKTWNLDLVYDSAGNDITGNYLTSSSDSKQLDILDNGNATLLSFTDSNTTSQNGAWSYDIDNNQLYVTFGTTSYKSISLNIDKHEFWLSDISNNQYHFTAK